MPTWNINGPSTNQNENSNLLNSGKKHEPLSIRSSVIQQPGIAIYVYGRFCMVSAMVQGQTQVKAANRKE
jgi:hypothetical protein